MTKSLWFRQRVLLVSVILLSAVATCYAEGEVDVKKVLKRAKSLVNSDEIGNAIELLKKSAADSDDPILDYELAELYLKNGQQDKATPLLEATVAELKKKAKLSSAEKKMLKSIEKKLTVFKEGEAELKKITLSAIEQWAEFAEKMLWENDYGSARQAVKQILAVDPQNKKGKELEALIEKGAKTDKPKDD